MPRPAKDLTPTAPILIQRGDKPELPVKDIARRLTVEDGKPLELTTRTTGLIANAAQFCLIYCERFHSKYAQARIGQIERLAVSMAGQGRRDLIDALQAGGAVPGEYYADTAKKKNYPVFTDNDGDE